MDTRNKIVTAELALARAAQSKTIVLLATFDVLTAARIRRIQEIAETGTLLVAVIAESPNSLLPLKARAELAASLAVTDLVVLVAEGPVSTIVNRFRGATIIDDTDAELRRTAELIEYVQHRHRTAC